MHPIRRELEFSLFRATSVPAFAPPARRGETRKETAGWAPRARPRGRPPRGQMGPRSGATVQGSAFAVCAFAARVFRIGYPLRRRVSVYARIACRARGCRAGSLFRLS